MFGGMSAHPFLAECWPAMAARDLGSVPVRHAVALARYFPAPAGEASDALIAETRRHIAGCLLAIETGLRLSLDRQGAMNAALDSLPSPLCWPMLCDHPAMASPALLTHMRLRAGVSLILRDRGSPDGEGSEPAGTADIAPHPDPAVGEAEALLALGEGRWAAFGGEHSPMRPDLPAEHYAELLWSAVAVLAHGLQARGLAEGPIALEHCERAGRALLDRHDEASGPFAAATRLVQLLGPDADAPDALGHALGQRRFLLFAALASRQARIDIEQILAVLLEGPGALIAALCRALGGSGVDLRHLLLTLRAVRPALTDAAIVAEAERYETLDANAVDPVMVLLRAPVALRSRLDLLRLAAG